MPRRSSRAEIPIWPGFVDAMTSLLMVLMFVITVFVMVQSVLRETITTQGGELNSLTTQLSDLADALGLERRKADDLQAEIGRLGSDLNAARAEGETQSALIATLNTQLSARQGELAAANARITSFEAQVASLLSERDTARGEATALTAKVGDLEAAQTKLLTQEEALNLALANARKEIDEGTEAARLAAARTDALNLLIEEMKAKAADQQAQVTALQSDLAGAKTELSEAEKTRLADLAAADALRERLKGADAELTAMTLALEEQRKRAEETLTLLAAANAAKAATDVELTEAQKRAGLLAAAQTALAQEKTVSAEGARRLALLNRQIAQLTTQLGSLQGLLDAVQAKDAASQVQLEALGNQLNSALAQVAGEQRRRAELEEAERKRLEIEAARLAAETTAAQDEAKQLERFRSEFFGQLRDLLAGREGVRIVGDRFVFSSEVLFQPGSADLLPGGQAQIAGVVHTLDEIAKDIPPGIDWIIRVDGHTDNVPLSGTGLFRDNWELSQARALAVVRYMQNALGFPPDRMAATGFGEYRPVATGDTPEARAQNRRIELKLTER
ncbi:MAG: peptidoglycan-binding protein [Cereibacter sphaeroides]|uniref:Peptidoglycan-binding protein n=1 Tax=Cereibacter sphaeroides TaxID=1063 RepID=A0A2W5SEQ8_CERSP|nr:MAG: peptidoglycan-binding protein [Cereibacter sphaeroides]